MRFFRSTARQLILSHVLVAALAFTGAVFLDLIQWLPRQFDILNRATAVLPGYEWRIGLPDRPDTTNLGEHWIGLVVSPEGEILYARGQTSCRRGTPLESCAPQWVGLPAGTVRLNQGGNWVRLAVTDTHLGQRIITEFTEIEISPDFTIGDFEIPGVLGFILTSSIIAGCAAVPLAVIVAAILVRWQTRRIKRLARVSRQFAQGDFGIRVSDSMTDGLGRLSQQFDSMADAITRNIQELRALGQHNAELRQQAEQSAVETERLRLSRELHDKIVQQLYDFSARASALSRAIDADPANAASEAHLLVTQAESALLNLRGALVMLRAREEQS